MLHTQNTGVRLLFIDDDELNAKAFAKRLERRGFVVDVLTDASSALDKLENGKYELVLLDIVMPDIDGISILKKIREQYSAYILPVIMVTVLDDSTDIFDAFELGANDYITKPLNIDAAAARITGQLSASALHKSNVKLKEVEAVAAMVITCHHEINNPLTVVKSGLQSLVKKNENLNAEETQKIFGAIDRIQETLQKIKEVADQKEINFATYAQTSKMVKIKD